MRGIAVLVVVLHHAAAVGGVAQCFAVVATGDGFCGGLAVVAGVKGRGGCGREQRGVVDGVVRRLFGVKKGFRQGLCGQGGWRGQAFHANQRGVGVVCGGIVIRFGGLRANLTPALTRGGRGLFGGSGGRGFAI